MWMHHFRKKRGSLDQLASSGARTLGRGRWRRSAPEGTPPPDVTTAVSAPGHLTLAGIVPQLLDGFVEEAEAVGPPLGGLAAVGIDPSDPEVQNHAVAGVSSGRGLTGPGPAVSR